jgi:hypothetical protein
MTFNIQQQNLSHQVNHEHHKYHSKLVIERKFKTCDFQQKSPSYTLLKQNNKDYVVTAGDQLLVIATNFQKMLAVITTAFMTTVIHGSHPGH